MTDKELKTNIKTALKSLDGPDFPQRALALFATLGYNTERRNPFPDKSYQFFKESFLEGDTRFNEEKALTTEWTSVDLLFQLSKDELSGQHGLFDTKQVDNTIIETYLFFAIELAQAEYTRTALAQITRELNKVFPMPVMIVFKHGQHATIAVINRRLHKRDAQKDVLEKVTVIKDISLESPHRAHVEILFDLSLEELRRVHKFTNFVELHQAWQKTLDTKELNKRFYRDLSHWYFWAMHKVTFPGAAMEANKKALFQQPEKVREHNAKNLIRLLTRLLFVWFIKEKKLIPDELFDESYIKAQLLDEFEPRKKSNFDYKTQGSRYYRAILQNLFFASLNQTVGKREFRNMGQHRNVTNLMRYEGYFKDPQIFLKLVEETVPFMNGGLFECLDTPDPNRKGPQGGDVIIYEDGFSDHKDNILSVPDYIFFGVDEQADLSGELGDKRQKNVAVNGLINILKAYKFTVTENTPIEEDIALDPELLGRVFENLLASYNPETQTTARKQTGSFYTPREIVNYMVDESLLAYLQTQLQTSKVSKTFEVSTEDRLRHLLAYNDADHQFTPEEVTALIAAIDAIKILDPACGSGAFPMGILHKLVHILHKLDPDNAQWREVQRQKALHETGEAFKLETKQERDARLQEISDVFERNADDYGRKLYLIENCIYGVDIQPIATQISKLRFFISLIVEQHTDRARDNFGIRPLPNLETKFVAANTLIGIEKPALQLGLFDTQEVKTMEAKLKEVRHRLFNAKTPATKRKLRDDDKTLRQKMGALLTTDGWDQETARQLAAWDPYDQNATSPFFDPEWMFGLSEGFDVVIGNPPYGFHQIHTASAKNYFRENYVASKGSYEHYFLFYECSLKSLNELGVLAFIAPVTWLTIPSALSLRKFILTNYFLQEISWFSEGVFEQASVNTLISFVRTTLINNVQIKIYDAIENFPSMPKEKRSIKKQRFIKDGHSINIFENAQDSDILQKIITKSKLLKEYARPCSGYNPYETGKGEAPEGGPHTRDTVKRKPYHSDFKNGPDWKPEIIGRNLGRYSLSLNGTRWVKYGPWLAAQRDKENFLGARILVQEITGGKEKRIVATYYDKELYYSRDVIPIKTPLEFPHPFYLLGIINSVLMTWYHHKRNPKAQKGLFPKVLVSDLKKLPIRKLSQFDNDDKNAHDEIVSLVNQILVAKAANPAAAVSHLEAEIDQLVYQLYGLTAEEIALVEESARP